MITRRLEHKHHVWNWGRFHKWSERDVPVDSEIGLITDATRVFGMGSCFAENVMRYLVTNFGLQAAAFEDSRFYDPVSVLQTVKHLLVEPQYGEQDLWTTVDGRHANPFRHPVFRTTSREHLMAWTARIEHNAARRLKLADVVVITLGGTECWRNPRTLKTYITIPFPDVFDMPGIAEFHNLSFAECYAALLEIYETLRREIPNAHVIFTVSPVRLTFTTSGKDVRVATCQSKSTLRAAVGELTDRYTDHLHYFESYEVVEYGPPGIDLYSDDNVHVSDLAVSIVMRRFGRRFLASSLQAKSNDALVRTALADARTHPCGGVSQSRPPRSEAENNYLPVEAVRDTTVFEA